RRVFFSRRLKPCPRKAKYSAEAMIISLTIIRTRKSYCVASYELCSIGPLFVLSLNSQCLGGENNADSLLASRYFNKFFDSSILHISLTYKWRNYNEKFIFCSG